MESIPLMQALSIFPLQTLRFTIRARQNIRLPHFPGSALRSLFGDPLKRTACLLANIVDCDICRIRKACALAYLYKTSLDTNEDNDKKQDFPRPYVINPSPVPEGGIPRGSCYQFEIVLIGNAVNLAQHVIDAIRIGGKEDGLGSTRAKFDLLTVASITRSGEQIIFPGSLKYFPDDRGQDSQISDCSEVDIYFETPLRLRAEGSNFNETPSFQLIVERILKRVTNLWEGHCSNTSLEIPEGYFVKASRIRLIDTEMYWKDTNRYSSFQKTKMKIGGMVDVATYQGDITPFLPLLRLVERINIGKATTMGLGKIHLECH